MVHSMTAFARAQQEIDGLVLSWELKSVNHRFLETQFRMPEPLRGLEHGLRELLRSHLKRGKVDCVLRAATGGDTGRPELNRPLLLQLLAILEQVRRDAPEIGAPNAVDLLRWPGLLGTEPPLDAAALTEPVEDLFEAALSDLIEHRRREGGQLLEAIEQRLNDIDRLVDEVKRHTASVSHQLMQRLRGRIDDCAPRRPGANRPGDRPAGPAGRRGRRARPPEHSRRGSALEPARPGPARAASRLPHSGAQSRGQHAGGQSVLAQTSQRAVDLKVVIEQIREQVQNLE
jgi:uncharacterized protein (TIGR00255 family)